MTEETIDRQCGECNLCCKLLVVEELEKPAHQWCPHVQLGVGCKIYDTKPKVCSDFKCLWLLGLVGEKQYPLKTKVVAHIGNSAFGETVYLYEDVRGYAKRFFSLHILGWQRQKLTTIIIHKNDDRIAIR